MSDQRWHFQNLATEDKYLEPGRGSIHTTTKPTVANSNVSKTKSLMNNVLYAALVISNDICWDAHRRVRRREVQYCLELIGSELFVQ